MAPVRFISPTPYDASLSNVTSYDSPATDNNSTSHNGTCLVYVAVPNVDGLSRHWKIRHAWLPIGLLALLAFLCLLWAMYMRHRLRKAQRKLREAQEEIADMRAVRVGGSGSGSGLPATMSEKMSGAPVVMVTPAFNGTSQEVVVTNASSGAPGSTTAGPSPTVVVSDANGGQTLVTSTGAGDGSAATGASSATPSTGAAGPSMANPTITESQTADPRAYGTTSPVVEQPQTVVEQPGLVVREAPRV